MVLIILLKFLILQSSVKTHYAQRLTAHNSVITSYWHAPFIKITVVDSVFKFVIPGFDTLNT